MKMLKKTNDLSFFEEMEYQRHGEYDMVMRNAPSYLKQDKILNYVLESGLVIKQTANMGRGVFAKRDLKRGELIVVEKAIAMAKQSVIPNQYQYNASQFVKYGANAQLVRKCSSWF